MNIEIRMGRLKDIPEVRKLAVESVIYGIPHTRDISPEKVQNYTRESLKDLEYALKMQKEFRLIIAEDLDENTIAGYLMLVLDEIEGSTGEKQGLIHDLAVKRKYWGKYVTHKLMARAAEITREYGHKYIIGEISASNKRALGTATKALGYEVERVQIVKKLF